MNYQPFLIAGFATGLDREVQPWLLPNDAYTDLLDGFVYRGVLNKRDGYEQFAIGIKSTPTESRMVHQIAAVVPATGVIDGANATFTWALTPPLARGRVVITGSNPPIVVTDNGLGGFTLPTTGTVNYTTGAVSVTFAVPPVIASTVLLTYSYHQGLPVMGIMNFYPRSNVRELIVADTTYVNRYNPSTDRLDDISRVPPFAGYAGTRTDFWSWVNYPDMNSVPRMLFSNGVTSATARIQSYDGTVITDYAYTLATVTVLNARQMFVFKGRLILFQTSEDNVLFPRRIRISGFGADCDIFSTTSPGAGLIDIPDTTWFFGAAFNRDDLLFFTETSTWALKFTGNDVKPFILQKIDGSRGSSAAFSAITYLNKTIAVSPRGLIGVDGYQVDRIDNNIPDYTSENINTDQTNFMECFSGFIDEDRDVYLIHPSKGDIVPNQVPAGSSDRILVINFEEDNLAVYRLPLSCMGDFKEAIGILWSDLTAANGFPTWDALAAKFDTWADFPFSIGSPIPIGGGHKGEIWQLNADGSQDNPLHVRGMTFSGLDLTVTTDWNNYNIGDYISFTGVGGMTGVNGKQGAIIDTADFYTFTVRLTEEPTGTYTANTGMASRVIPFEAVGKKLNPYINQDKKLKCGWMYFYVSVAQTSLIDDQDVAVRAFLKVDVLTNNNEGTDFSNPTFSYLVDCSPINNEKGGKKWVKIWINQVGQFLQYKLSNTQANTHIQVHATMCGFQPVGRLI